MKGAAASFGVITEFVVHTEPAPTNMIQYSYRIQCVQYISSRSLVPTIL
jgi:hypothetical protein